MNVVHQELASGRWQKLSLVEQLANIGSEIERTIKWRLSQLDYSKLAFNRALELLDLSIADRKNQRRLKELLRLRETLADYFVFKNQYSSDDASWRKYFFAYNYAARV
ncbi:MAG: hypothetical protein ABH823_00640 [bacterium]